MRVGSQRRICSIAVDHSDILKLDGVNATKNALQEGCELCFCQVASMGRLRLCDVNEHSKPSVEWWTSK